jgi:hypothetical protein
VHVLALSLSLGLAVLFVGRWVARMLPEALSRFEGMSMMALGILAAWLADFDAWAAWDVPVREHWIGIVLTGLAIGGLASVWGELMGFVHGFARKSNDEAEVIERQRDLSLHHTAA